MSPPRFFLSYARRDGDRYLDRFFEDLRKEIAFREGLYVESDEAGFRDTQSMATAQDWSSGLAKALREAWACVSLYTPRYFSREYCGKEFKIFLDRDSVTYDENGAATNSRSIFPVLWAAMSDLKRKALPPAVASRINFNGYEHQARYEADGLREILKKSPRGAYADIIRYLVEDLIAFYESGGPPPLGHEPKLKDIENSFTGERAEAKRIDGEQRIGGGPARLALFILIPEDSLGAFGASGVQPTLRALDDEEIEADTQVIDTYTAEPSRVVDMLGEANVCNALTVMLVYPPVNSDEKMRLLELLKALGQARTWMGAVLFRRVPDTMSAEELSSQFVSSIGESDDFIVKIVEGEQPEFMRELKRVMLVLRKRVVEDGAVKRNLPGGGTPTERPMIQGPKKVEHHE